MKTEYVFENVDESVKEVAAHLLKELARCEENLSHLPEDAEPLDEEGAETMEILRDFVTEVIPGTKTIYEDAEKELGSFGSEEHNEYRRESTIDSIREEIEHRRQLLDLLSAIKAGQYHSVVAHYRDRLRREELFLQALEVVPNEARDTFCSIIVANSVKDRDQYARFVNTLEARSSTQGPT